MTKRKAAKDRKPRGRPSTYTEAMAIRICAQLADGESLKSICRGEGMPAIQVVYGWLSKRPEFAARYARAREEQADTLADEIVAIADDGKNDTYTDENGFEHVNQENVQRSKLRVDARKWVAAKLKPKKYGERVMGDADNPIRVDHSGQVNLYIPDNNRTKPE